MIERHDGSGGTRVWTRRRFLEIGAALGVGAWLGASPVGTALAQQPATAGVRSRHPRSVAAGYDFLGRMTDAYDTGDTLRLAQSYDDDLGLFTTAFVYDNALAVNAYLLARSRAATDRARLLGDALLYAQEHDPDHADGRVRQAYNVGPYVFYDGTPQPHNFVLPDGTANIGWQFGFTGSAVGDMAWVGIALVQLAERTRERRYLDGAVRIGEWIVDRTFSTQPLGGYRFGVDGADQPVTVSSTEHNIDVVGLFHQLRVQTGEPVWEERGAHARAFVERMWEPDGGFFYTGTNDGVEINRDPLPLDPQTWSWLAMRDDRYAAALDWAATALRTTDTADQPNSQVPQGVSISGVAFSTASLVAGGEWNPQAVWLEGTGQLATSLFDRGRRTDALHAQTLLREIRTAQAELGRGQTVGGEPLPPSSGVVAASSPMDTGFGFGYFPSQHVGATVWYLIAAGRGNPFQPKGLRGRG